MSGGETGRNGRTGTPKTNNGVGGYHKGKRTKCLTKGTRTRTRCSLSRNQRGSRTSPDLLLTLGYFALSSPPPLDLHKSRSNQKQENPTQEKELCRYKKRTSSRRERAWWHTLSRREGAWWHTLSWRERASWQTLSVTEGCSRIRGIPG